MILISFSAHSQQQDTTKTHPRDSLFVLKQLGATWDKADSANHKANSKIDSAQSVINKMMNPDVKKLTLKLSENRAKKRAKRTKADTLGIPSDSVNTQAGKATSPQDITKKVEKVSNDVLDPDLNKIADRLNQKRAQRLAGQGMTATTGAVVNEPGDHATIANGSLSERVSIDSVQQLKSIESKITNIENEVGSKINPPVEDLSKRINTPIEQLNKKANTGLNTLSKEAMGKSDLPSSAALPNVSTSGTNSLPTSITGNLPLPESNHSITGKMPDAPADLLKDKASDFNADKLKGGINNPLKDKKEEVDKLKQEVDGKVQDKMKGVTDSKPVNGLQEQSTKVNAATDKVQGYSKDIENIKKGDVEKVDELKKDAMDHLPTKEFSEGQDQLKAMDQEMEKMKALKNKEAFKKQTMAKAREEVVKQIIAQNGKMMPAVDKISIYQKQGGALAGMVKGLPSRPLKSRKPPLIERFVPGITLQFQKGNKWLIDLNPTLRFKVRSILSTGLGYNYRVVIEPSGTYKREERIFGIRSFAEFSIRKGLSMRADVERMSAYVPLVYAQPDVKQRKYVWSYMVGLRKDFGFGAGVLGNVQFMYNIYDPKHESPYLNRLNVRFGFEFPMKKKKGAKK